MSLTKVAIPLTPVSSPMAEGKSGQDGGSSKRLDRWQAHEISWRRKCNQQGAANEFTMASRHLEMEIGDIDPLAATLATNVEATTKGPSPDANKKKLSALLDVKLTLDKLEPGKNKKTILVRILRMWEARNFKQNGALMSLDLLLIDEKEDLIQGSIYYRRIHMFKDLLKEGQIYMISDFEVIPSYSHYKVTDNQFTMRFTDSTQIIAVGEEVCAIRREKFRIHSHAEFQSFAETNIQLLDVLGQVISMNGSHLDDANCKQKIVLLLLLQDNSTIRFTLWDDQAAEFRRQFKQADRDSTVIVGTCLNPKMFGGKLYLNSTMATKVYINYDLEVIKEFMERMGLEGISIPTKIVEEDTINPSFELLTVQEILEYISSGVNQEKEVICRAKIVDINGRSGWKYLSCSTCSRKLGTSGTSLICNHCNSNTTIGVARFRVEVIVKNGDRTTTFVLFDRDAKKITHTTAEGLTLAAMPPNEGETSSAHEKIPGALLEMIGKTFAFQVKITDYNFQTSAQTFTVTRLIPPALFEEMVSKPRNMKEIKTEDGGILPTFQKEGESNEPVAQKDEENVDGPENYAEENENAGKKMRLN